MSNTTTLVRGWKLTREDGRVMGFTDCDVDLTVEGVTYEAAAALSPSEAVTSLGLAVDEQEVQGSINSDAVTEEDLARGLFDGAKVEVIEIDWSTQTRHVTVGHYYLGEVSRTEVSFTAELRSEAGNLAQKRGRYVTSTCDAELGDARCGFDATALQLPGTIATLIGEADFVVEELADDTDKTYSGGVLVWTSGANLGQRHDVRAHRGNNLGLWRAPLDPMSAGDCFNLLPGCDKSISTCHSRFANIANFRGFPAIVGEEAFTYAVPGESGHDGASRNDF